MIALGRQLYQKMPFAVTFVSFYSYFNKKTMLTAAYKAAKKSLTFSFKCIEALLSWSWTSNMVDLVFLDFYRIDSNAFMN